MAAVRRILKYGMGLFESESSKAAREAEKAVKDNDAGQKAGSQAGFFEQFLQGTIGTVMTPDAYAKGFENGVRNPSKPEKSSSPGKSSTSTSTDSSGSESGSDYSTSDCSTSDSSTSSFGGCAVVGGLVIGAVVLIANLFSGTGGTPSRLQPQQILSPPPQQIASPKPQLSISEKQQNFLSPPSQQHGVSPIRVRALGMKKALSLEEAHAEIGQVYQAAMRSLTPAQQTVLRDEQREWIKWRDAQADRVARRLPTGPNSYSVDHEKEMISLVAERTRYLEDYKPTQQSIPEKQQNFLSPSPQQHAASPIRVRALGMKKALSLEEAHAEIGQVYQAAMNSLTPAQQTTLRDEQREWIKWRDAQADILARRFPTGPTSYSADHEKAMISLLGERIRNLEDYRPGKTTNVPNLR